MAYPLSQTAYDLVLTVLPLGVWDGCEDRMVAGVEHECVELELVAMDCLEAEWFYIYQPAEVVWWGVSWGPVEGWEIWVDGD